VNDGNGAVAVAAPRAAELAVPLRHARRTGGVAPPIQAVRPRRRAVCQTRQWSCGIGMWVTPKWAKASLTALEKAETPPTFGDSPTPLAPIGWCGDGVVV
jgi:hypothetical protein